MGASDKYLMKPGTVLIFLVATVVGMSIFNWSGAVLDRAGNSSEKQRNQAVKCSNLELEFVNSKTESGNFTVFFQVNRDVEAAAVTFYSNGNKSTEVVESISRGATASATTGLTEVEKVEAVLAGCDRVFSS